MLNGPLEAISYNCRVGLFVSFVQKTGDEEYKKRDRSIVSFTVFIVILLEVLLSGANIKNYFVKKNKLVKEGKKY